MDVKRFSKVEIKEFTFSKWQKQNIFWKQYSDIKSFLIGNDFEVINDFAFKKGDVKAYFFADFNGNFVNGFNWEIQFPYEFVSSGNDRLHKVARSPKNYIRFESEYNHGYPFKYIFYFCEDCQFSTWADLESLKFIKKEYGFLGCPSCHILKNGVYNDKNYKFVKNKIIEIKSKEREPLYYKHFYRLIFINYIENIFDEKFDTSLRGYKNFSIFARYNDYEDIKCNNIFLKAYMNVFKNRRKEILYWYKTNKQNEHINRDRFSQILINSIYELKKMPIKILEDSELRKIFLIKKLIGLKNRKRISNETAKEYYRNIDDLIVQFNILVRSLNKKRKGVFNNG